MIPGVGAPLLRMGKAAQATFRKDLLMLRRVATSVALSAALVLGASASAMAHHAEPDDTLKGNVKSCAGIVDGSYWEKSANVPHKIPHPWWTVSFSKDNKSLSVTLTDAAKNANAVLAVLVKGGQNTNLFLGAPGEDLLDLFAPVNKHNNKHPEISNYTICKVKPPVEEPPEEEPPAEEPPAEEPPAEEPPAEQPPTDEPEPDETPVPVPTAVPAGNGSSNGSPFGMVALLAALGSAFAAAAVTLRRRLGNDG